MFAGRTGANQSGVGTRVEGYAINVTDKYLTMQKTFLLQITLAFVTRNQCYKTFLSAIYGFS